MILKLCFLACSLKPFKQVQKYSIRILTFHSIAPAECFVAVIYICIQICVIELIALLALVDLELKGVFNSGYHFHVLQHSF